MADRTVRAIFEARVTGAQKGMRDLSTDVSKAGKQVDGLTKDLKTLDGQKVTPTIDVAIGDAKKKIRDLTIDLGTLRQMKVTPVVEADIKDTERKLAEAKKALRQLDNAKAELKVTADTDAAKGAIDGLANDIGDAGKEGGADAGEGVASGIIDALRSIPIAGAIVGVGAAIAGGLILGIKQGLSIEAERDLFSAQTGLDEATSARFGRAAGEAYANAWGDSVAANLDTARLALKGGLIDETATDAEIENVIAKLTGIADLFDFDIAESVRAVGNLMKTGLVKDANQAFDLITAASRKVQSDDLLDTLNEYSNQFVKLGLTADQAFGLIAQGAAAGARDTDNIADTLKEMGLRIREGLDPAVAGLKLLGLNADDIVRAFQEGGPRAADAMDKVFDALRDLEEKGGNTQAVIAALFGGPGEDLGAALFALDLDTVAEALGGVDGAAGAADEALKTMSDNTATRMEEAKRNIEIAMDGIKGALAEAFGDDIAGAADWVSKNRAPLLEFFVQVMDGTFEMGRSFLNFSETALRAIADVIDGIADLIDSLPGDQSELKASMNGIADGLRAGADEIHNEFIPALDDAQDKADRWVAPEILKARVHDATVAMTEDMKNFVKEVGEGDLSVTINGDTANAEEALATLVENIDGEDGTVLINGDKVPAEDALDELLRLIADGEEDVTVGADTDTGEAALRRYLHSVDGATGTVGVNADTSAAKRALDALTGKDYYATVRVNIVSDRVAVDFGVGGQHDGGWIAKGLHAGGRVPGSDPGYDNVLWPLNSGGRTLMQPLAGGEFVVNSKDSAYWGPLLEWINGGGRPTTHTETTNAPIYVDKIVTPDLDGFRRRADEERKWRSYAKGLG